MGWKLKPPTSLQLSPFRKIFQFVPQWNQMEVQLPFRSLGPPALPGTYRWNFTSQIFGEMDKWSEEQVVQYKSWKSNYQHEKQRMFP